MLMVFCCLLHRTLSSFLFEIESKKQRSVSPVLESRETLKASFKTICLHPVLLHPNTFVYTGFSQHFTVCSQILNEITYPYLQYWNYLHSVIDFINVTSFSTPGRFNKTLYFEQNKPLGIKFKSPSSYFVSAMVCVNVL